MPDPFRSNRSRALGWPETIVITILVVMAALATGSILSTMVTFSR